MPRFMPPPRQVSYARNRTLPVPVEQSITYYEDRKRRETDTAIQVSGIDAIIYPFIRAGRPCTCDSGVPLLNDQGNLTQQQLNAFFNNPHELETVEDEEDEQEAPSLSRGSANTLRSKKVYHAEDVDFDETKVVDDPATPEDETAINSGEEAVFGEEFMGNDFLDYGASTCAICLGKGYIKGYSPYRGYHLILTVGDQVAMDDFRVNTVARPFAFALASTDTDGGYVDFHMIVPKTGRLIASRLMNNLVEVKNYTLAVVTTSTDTPPVVTVTPISDPGVLADGVPHVLRVTCPDEFTHYEALFDAQGIRCRIDFPQVDTGQFSKNLTGDDNPTIEVSMPSYVSNVGKHSLIREFKYNRVWYVTSATPQLNAQGTEVVFMELSARLVQPHEIYNGIL